MLICCIVGLLVVVFNSVYIFVVGFGCGFVLCLF